MNKYIVISLWPLFAAGHVLGQTVTWDGGDPASPNTGGVWNNTVNWDAGALPTTTNLTVLPSVTDGSTRTVTQDIVAGTTVNALQFIQSSPTGVNKLSLSGNIILSAVSRESATVDSTGTAFRVSLSGGATVDQVQVDLNGFSINSATPNGANGGMNIAGTINFNSAGSSMVTTGGGHTAINVFGALEATANGRIGRDTGGTASTGNGSINMMAGSTLDITGGVFSVEMAGRRSQSRALSLNNSGTITIASGATLAEVWTATSNSTQEASVTLTNQSAGVINQSGTVALRVHHDSLSTNSPGISLVNNGTWTVSGSDAVVRRLTTSDNTAYVTVPAMTIGTTGILKGNSAADALEYNEEVALSNRMLITNNGTIRAGNGSGGTGLSSVGSLALRDTNLTFGSTGELEMDFGGFGAGQFDQLNLQTGVTDAAGAGTLDLSTVGDTLALALVNSFTPGLSFNVSLITAGSVLGEFDTVTLDSVLFTANQLTVTEGTYTINYTPTAVNLSFVAIPEPSSYLLVSLGLAGLGYVVRRRARTHPSSV